MTGRRLLDVAAIVKASRGVAAKHVALRQHQLDVYSKTSSLAKAIKSQTDRVTLTVNAASKLAERFSGPAPNHSTQETQFGRFHHDTSIVGQDPASGVYKSPEKKDTVGKDSTPSGQDKNLKWQTENQIPSQTLERPPAAYSEEPNLQADRDRDIFYTPSLFDEQVVSALPRVKVPRNTEDAQDSDEHVPDAVLNQNVFYSTSSISEEQPLPQAQAIPEQDQPSDEAYSELFHSPRVARMLGGQPKSGKSSKSLQIPGAQKLPIEQTKRPQEKDYVSSSTRTSASQIQDGVPSPSSEIVDSRPSIPSHAKDSDDIHDLAAEVAKDAADMPADSSQRNPVREMSLNSMLVD